MADPIPPRDEWEEHLLTYRYAKLIRIAKAHSLDPWTGVRWYSRDKGVVWFIGDAKYVVPILLAEPTTDAAEAIERVLRGEVVDVPTGRASMPAEG